MFRRFLAKLTRNSGADTSAPPGLLDALIAARLKRDQAEFTRLARTHAEAIVREFPSWRQMPEALRSDASAVQAYGSCLLEIAHCMQWLGHPAPLQLLLGDDTTNPIDRWHLRIKEADVLESAGDLDGAHRVLAAVADEMGTMRGSAVDQDLGKVLGRLGMQRYDMGDVTGAMEFTSRALDECRRTGDAEGVRVYSENMQVLRRAGNAPPEATQDVRRAIAQAQELSDDGAYEASIEILDRVMRDGTLAAESDPPSLMGKAHGLYGLNLYRLDELERARRATADAIAACTRAGDAQGTWAYTRNLETIDAAMARRPG